jgi:hypothetical protein
VKTHLPSPPHSVDSGNNSKRKDRGGHHAADHWRGDPCDHVRSGAVRPHNREEQVRLENTTSRRRVSKCEELDWKKDGIVLRQNEKQLQAAPLLEATSLARDRQSPRLVQLSKSETQALPGGTKTGQKAFGGE